MAALTVLALASACGGDSASECRRLASDTYGRGETQFTEVTFTDGDFIKGRIGAYVDGDELTVGYWECSTETGEAAITFYSPAG